MDFGSFDVGRFGPVIAAQTIIFLGTDRAKARLVWCLAFTATIKSVTRHFPTRQDRNQRHKLIHSETNEVAASSRCQNRTASWFFGFSVGFLHISAVRLHGVATVFVFSVRVSVIFWQLGYMVSRSSVLCGEVHYMARHFVYCS